MHGSKYWLSPCCAEFDIWYHLRQRLSQKSVKLSWLGWIIWVIEIFLPKLKNFLPNHNKWTPNNSQNWEKEQQTTTKTEKSLKHKWFSSKEEFFMRITTYDWRLVMKKTTPMKSLKSFLVQAIIVFKVYENRRLRAFHC